MMPAVVMMMRNYTYLALLPKASKDVAFKCIPTNVEAFGGGGRVRYSSGKSILSDAAPSFKL
jgi:hypothetical protein